MRKNFAIVSLAAVVLLAGCAKEELCAPQSFKLKVTISGDATKTTIGELADGKRPVYWANGDQIAVNGEISKALEGVEAQSREAEFEFENAPSAPFNIVYPATIYANPTTVVLPSAGKADKIVIPMGGQGSTINALTGVVKIGLTLAEDTDKIAKVILTAKDNKQLAGTFTIDYAAGTLTGTDASAENASIAYATNAVLSDTPYEVFFPVPAGQYEFTVKVVDANGHYMTKETTSAKTIAAGQVTALPAFAFVPTGTELGIEITSAADLVKFAQDYNAGIFADENPLVTLTSDITFDNETSASYRATGGIGVAANEELGTPDNYFNGTFNGAGHTIKSFANYAVDEVKTDSITVSVPLFNYTGNAAIIKDFTIDSSCDIKIPKGNFGVVAYRSKGEISGITCNANVTILPIAGTTLFGGIVSRVYGGKVLNCTMNGNIICNSTFGTTKNWKLGGVVGSVEEGGLVENCKYSGVFQWGTASAGNGPSLKSSDFCFGGIAAHVMNGTLRGCTTVAAAKSHDIRGTAGLHGYVGGIAAIVDEGSTIENCTNAQLAYVRSKGPSDNPEAYMYIGGVAGWNKGAITGSSNSAQFTGNTAQPLLALGGVVGKNDGEITSSTNSGKIIGPTQYTSVTTFYEGGIAGWTTTGLSDLENTGDITYSSTCDTQGSLLNVVRALGGVVGYVENDITLSNLKNSGKINFDRYQDNASPKNSKKLNSSGSIVGGVVGFVNGPVSVTNCSNDGVIYNNIWDNTSSPMISAGNAGGVVGVVFGTDGQSAVIDGCTNDAGLYCRRGNIGGICAWAKRAEIKNCIVSIVTPSDKENISSNLGGIAAMADTSAVISSCNVKDVMLVYKPATAACTTGGIVAALLDATASVKNCQAIATIQPATSDSEANCAWGGIAGKSAEGSQIWRNKFKVGYGIKGNEPELLTIFEICSDNNFDDDGENEVIDE